jgi:hypothetical protein
MPSSGFRTAARSRSGLGPHWSERRTSPPHGYYTKTTAQVKLSTQIDYEHIVTRYKAVFDEKFGSGSGPEHDAPPS